MKYAVEPLIWLFCFAVIIILANIGGIYLYKIDLQKCYDISSNEYYYADNNCWETVNRPNMVIALATIILAIIPCAVLVIFLIVRYGGII